MLKCTTRTVIHGHYTDVRNRLFIKTLCDLFNDVANKQTLLLGVDVDTFQARGITWMLHKIHIRVSRMPVKGEEVLLETWPSGADRLFATRDFHIVTPEGEELVKLTSEWMVIDLERRRPVRLPENVLCLAKHYEGVVRDLSFELDVKTVPHEFTGARRFVASYEHIDFNLHVTQASYVGWLTNSLPYDFLKSHKLEDLEVVFEHEVLPESEVDSAYLFHEEHDRTVVFHRVNAVSGDRTHCVARSVYMKEERNV